MYNILMKSKVDTLRDNIMDYVLQVLSENNDMSLQNINSMILSKTTDYSVYVPTLDSLLKRAVSEGLIESSVLFGEKIFNITPSGRKFKNGISVIWLTQTSTADIIRSGATIYEGESQDNAEFILHPSNDGSYAVEMIFDRGPEFVSPDVVEQIGVFEDVPIVTPDDRMKEKAKALLFGNAPLKSEKKKANPLPLLSEDVIATKSAPVIRQSVASSAATAKPIPVAVVPPIAPVAPVPVRKKSNLEVFLSNIDDTEPYRTSLENIFAETIAVEPVATQAKSETAESAENTPSVFSYSDLKIILAKDGYTLKPFSHQTAIGYYSSNFFFSAKLLRDTLSFGYIFSLLTVFACYFIFENLSPVGIYPYVFTAVAMLIFPLFGWINFLVQPDKRKRAQFDLKIAMSGLLMMYINLIVIAVLIGFLFLKVNVENVISMLFPIFYPAALLLFLPVCGIIYGILYNSKRYHIK